MMDLGSVEIGLRSENGLSEYELMNWVFDGALLSEMRTLLPERMHSENMKSELQEPVRLLIKYVTVLFMKLLKENKCNPVTSMNPMILYDTEEEI